VKLNGLEPLFCDLDYASANVTAASIAERISPRIALGQLDKLPSLQARRRALWEQYQHSLSSFAWIERPPELDADSDRRSYFTYLIRTP
jgi:dTDP-4-amino-4,6-dideoxygalactose transaminase